MRTLQPGNFTKSLQSECMSCVPGGWRDKARRGVIKRGAVCPCGWRDKTLKGVIIHKDMYVLVPAWSVSAGIPRFAAVDGKRLERLEVARVPFQETPSSSSLGAHKESQFFKAFPVFWGHKPKVPVFC